VMKSGMHAILL